MVVEERSFMGLLDWFGRKRRRKLEEREFEKKKKK